MLDFWTWLLTEARNELVPSVVLQSWERAFQQELEALIARTRNLVLRHKFEEMRQCPIYSRGRCWGFVEYILAALLRTRIHERYDVEGVLAYICERMLVDRTDAGRVRLTVFRGFRERSGPLRGNPLQSRFLKALDFAIKNISAGRIPRLLRPQNTGPGHRRSPDQVPARPSTDTDVKEMIEDIKTLLNRKEVESGLPLLALFRSMLSGETTGEQRAKFGDRTTRQTKKAIRQVIEDYAGSSGNVHLQRLMQRFVERTPDKRPRSSYRVRSEVSPDHEDYRTIVSFIQRLRRPVGLADLGRFRRRWIMQPPREPRSRYRTRMEEVLSNMIRDGFIVAHRTAKGALLYSPGPNFHQYVEWGGTCNALSDNQAH